MIFSTNSIRRGCQFLYFVLFFSPWQGSGQGSWPVLLPDQSACNASAFSVNLLVRFHTAELFNRSSEFFSRKHCPLKSAGIAIQFFMAVCCASVGFCEDILFSSAADFFPPKTFTKSVLVLRTY
jgi:hypothetical protein